MEHDDNVRTSGERFAVAGLLVPAISVIRVVDKGQHTQAARTAGSIVAAGVIDQDSDVHNVGQLGDGALQGFFGVICRHHHCDSLAVQHDRVSFPSGLWNYLSERVADSGVPA